MLALRYHPDKNQGDPSAKELFQEVSNSHYHSSHCQLDLSLMSSLGTKIQAAYETLSENDKRAKYDTTVGFVRSNHSARTWREPSYDPCYYTQDPPFWSVELHEMTVQKCARIGKIQQLEREIKELVIDLNDMVDAETKASTKEKKALARFSIIRLRSPKINTQRHQDFLTQSAHINTRLNEIKTDLRTAHEDHKSLLEKDNKRKTWWARERVRRVEEENRRAATTAAEAARRRTEREREYATSEWGPTRVGEEIRQRAREEGMRRARELRKEEETRVRAERAREDPEGARRAEKEAQDWLEEQRVREGCFSGTFRRRRKVV